MDHPNLKALRDTVARKKAEALSVIHTAEAQGRDLTTDERAQVRTALDAGETAKLELVRQEALDAQVNGLTATPGGSDLFDRFKAAGFKARHAPGTIAFKDFTEASPLNAVDQRREAGAALGADRRYAFPAFPQVPVSAGLMSVSILRQVSRALASPANMNRVIDSVAPKPETSSARELVVEAMRQIATVSGPIPNVHLANGAGDLLQGDMRLAFNEALDELVLDALYGNGLPVSPGADLTHSIFAAVEALSAEGYAANVLIVSPFDATALALAQTAGPEEMYQRPPFPDGVSIRVSKSAANPIVADSSAAARLYLSPVTLDSDSSGDLFTSNQTQLRLEAHGLFVVDRAEAVAIIGGGS